MVGPLRPSAREVGSEARVPLSGDGEVVFEQYGYEVVNFAEAGVVSEFTMGVMRVSDGRAEVSWKGR